MNHETHDARNRVVRGSGGNAHPQQSVAVDRTGNTEASGPFRTGTLSPVTGDSSTSTERSTGCG